MNNIFTEGDESSSAPDWVPFETSAATSPVRDAVEKKLRDYLGIFPNWRAPPPNPPFWEPLIKKK